MKFTFKPSPNYRNELSTARIMNELTFGLLLVYLFAVIFYFTKYGAAYGMRVILLLVTALIVAIGTEIIWCVVLKKDVLNHLKNSFPWVTAIILTLMVPVGIEYYALAVATFFAIFFGKLVFGGFGHNIFNPAAVGRATIFASFATATVADVVTGATPTGLMASYGWIIEDPAIADKFLSSIGGLQNMLFGWYPGAIGETSALLILIVGIYLVIRKVIDWRVPTVFIGTVFLLSSVVGVMHGAGIWYPLFHVLTGGVMFGAVFMATDPVTNPTSAAGRIIFALGCGIITVLIRIKANLPEGVLYSILLMNMLTPAIERLTDGQQIKMLKKNIISIAVIFLFGVGSVALAANVIVAKEPTPTEGEPGKPTDAPSLTLGNPTALNNEEGITRYKPTVVSETANGDTTTYVIEINGYGMLEGDSSHFDYSKNQYEVIIDTANSKVVSVKYVVFGDTAGFGDKTDTEEYFNLFKDLPTEDQSATIDVVTGATFTSKSMIYAVNAAIDASKK